MTAHKTRGLKRKCQNEDCALPFYDLNREQFDCPNCGEPFDLTEAPTAWSAYPSRRKPREFQIVAPEGPEPSAQPKA
jgi:hypothetical protein